VLEAYIPPRARLLELGAGFGRYAIHYSLLGHHVTAIEIVPAQVESLKAKIAKGESGDLTVYLGDARNLRMIADESVDVVLCLGPLYHLQRVEDRLRCVQEAVRVLKPGGILAAAYVNRYMVAAMTINRDVQMIHTGFLEPLRDQGLIQHPQFDPFAHAAYYATPDEMESLLAQGGMQVIDHLATGGVAKLIEQVVNRMDEAAYQQWFRYHLSICRERSILGYSTHGLLIGRQE
jgi:SAM-dependent methyltransferase